jgi:hypothetical protein
VVAAAVVPVVARGERDGPRGMAWTVVCN